MTNQMPLAAVSVDTSNGNGATQLFAGESDIVTSQGALVASVAYVMGQVLGRITASGLYTKHDPAASDGSQFACAILAYDVPASTTKKEAVYLGGVFNLDALTFNAATNTDLKKTAVFDRTNIVAQKLYGAPPAGSGPV